MKAPLPLPVLVARVGFEVKIFYFLLQPKIKFYLITIWVLSEVIVRCLPASLFAIFGMEFEPSYVPFYVMFSVVSTLNLTMIFNINNIDKFLNTPKQLYWSQNHFVTIGVNGQEYIKDEILILKGKKLMISGMLSLRITDNVLIDKWSLCKMIELNRKWHQDIS